MALNNIVLFREEGNEKVIYSTVADDTFLEVITPDTIVRLPGKKDDYKVLAVNKLEEKGSILTYEIMVAVV